MTDPAHSAHEDPFMVRRWAGPKIKEHRGRIPGFEPGDQITSDGLLVEFASVVDAVRCAVA